MARIIEQQNVWGRTLGQEPQRQDLWSLDMTSAVKQIAEQLGLQLPDIPSYFAASITLPEQRVQNETVRRDSRPYQMPSWDIPLEPVRVNFMVDGNTNAEQSIIYQVLDAWRTLVRAGRGGMSTELSVDLNQNYRVDYNFDIIVYLLRGNLEVNSQTVTQSAAQQVAFTAVRYFSDVANQWKNPATKAVRDRVFNFAAQYDYQNPGESDEDYEKRMQMQLQVRQQLIAAQIAAKQTNSVPPAVRDVWFEAAFNNNLKISTVIQLKRAWLSAMRFAELNYANNGALTIEAQFFVEDIVRQVASGNKPDVLPGFTNTK